MKNQNRRQHVRVTRHLPAQLKVASGETFESGTVDISRGGALLDCPASLAVGHPIEISLQAGPFQLDPVEGRVKRSNPIFWNARHLVAVKFQEENEAVMEALNFLRNVDRRGPEGDLS